MEKIKKSLNKFLFNILSTFLIAVPFVWFSWMNNVFKPDDILKNIMLFFNLIMTFPVVLILFMYLESLNTRYKIEKENKIKEFGEFFK